MMEPLLTLRPAQPEDDPFLLSVFVQERRLQLAALPLSEEQKARMLEQQYLFQKRSYQAEMPGFEEWVVICEVRDVGRMLLSRDEAEIRLLDLTLAPDSRGQGIGGRVLEALKDQCRSTGAVLRLSVYHDNLGARRFYDRLGFSQNATDDLQAHLSWSPATKG